jgi:hypothetical protein
LVAECMSVSVIPIPVSLTMMLAMSWVYASLMPTVPLSVNLSALMTRWATTISRSTGSTATGS